MPYNNIYIYIYIIIERKRHDDTNTEYRLVKDNKSKFICSIYILKLKSLPKEQLMSHLCFCTMRELWVGRPVTASVCTDVSFLSMFRNTYRQQNTWKAKPDKPVHPALLLFIATSEDQGKEVGPSHDHRRNPCHNEWR